MPLIGFASLHGAPGTSTLALAVAHHWASHTGRAALFVEADPDGGVLAARHGLSLQPGLTELAGAARLGLAPAELARFIQSMSSGVPAIVAHPAAEQTSAALRTAAAHLATTLAEVPNADAVIDLGRLRPNSPAMALAAACDSVVLTVRCAAEDLVTLLTRLPAIERIVPVELALVGRAPYPVDEVRRTSGIESIHLVPLDESAVRSDPVGARGRRSGWSRAVSGLTAALARQIDDDRLSGDHGGLLPAEDLATAVAA